jgi:hypothetical protein
MNILTAKVIIYVQTQHTGEFSLFRLLCHKKNFPAGPPEKCWGALEHRLCYEMFLQKAKMFKYCFNPNPGAGGVYDFRNFEQV